MINNHLALIGSPVIIYLPYLLSSNLYIQSDLSKPDLESNLMYHLIHWSLSISHLCDLIIFIYGKSHPAGEGPIILTNPSNLIIDKYPMDEMID